MSRYNKALKQLDGNPPIWASRINQRLYEMNLSQLELSLRTGVPEATISAWTGGNGKKYTEPRVTGIILLSKALNTTSDFLLGLEELPMCGYEQAKSELGMTSKEFEAFKEINIKAERSEDVSKTKLKMIKAILLDI